MTGFEPRTSGVGSNRSTDWATTIAQNWSIIIPQDNTIFWLLHVAKYWKNSLAIWDWSYKDFTV